jgi:hypothetical protein
VGGLLGVEYLIQYLFAVSEYAHNVSTILKLDLKMLYRSHRVVWLLGSLLSSNVEKAQ